MPDWRLRRAGPDDAAAVALVSGSTFLETYAGMLPGRDIVAHCGRNGADAYAGFAADPRVVLTVAEHPDGGAPVGFTLLAPPDLPIGVGPDDLELRRIYALATTYGTGLGWALMTRAIEDARGLGAKRLLLGMNKLNHRAHTFYERQGFAVIGERIFVVGDTPNQDFILARAI
ncbi:GNAT family N-acetyltransferase [Sphingomonas sp.]|jgi:GNAT superfamily N-acetyltransferase|uniref:GNAT family N-acetyltransferase n=1 Tax=Sphingomonas sp. TaxID=28214 RepID=UPI002D80923C|nr:GNAT family N-acetyltransferase [Sphingomonas sp.]HEU0044731.1 GNAT family N-acetyltransferase [Sphingomonas sp.]